MLIEVKNVDTNEVITVIKARSNLKNIHARVEKELAKIAGQRVRMIPQGTLNMGSGRFDGHYLTMGTFGDIRKITYSVTQ